MSDKMRPVAFSELAARIIKEFTAHRSVFGINENDFLPDDGNRPYSIAGETCAGITGPAAGPHTQLAQNIASAYLCGGRFFELKTVQIMDELEIPKPCIDARDECYNTEWSSEFTVAKAYDEYLKAWFLLYLLEAMFGTGDAAERSFIFNMSVGYDLEGIQSPKIDGYINDLMNSAENPLFEKYRKTLAELTEDSALFEKAGLKNRIPVLENLADRISPNLCSQITLSTMHGCPPGEIESICRHLLETKKLNTYVKLNPTLLGYDFIRDVLDGHGFDYIELKKELFRKDLSLKEAVPMLKRLKKSADERGLLFGVKLTNTLAVSNNEGFLPGGEMYMSGRMLFPFAVNTASLLAGEFEGELPVSFSGGASVFNIESLLASGIRPVTVATDLLKPGGFVRLRQTAEAAGKAAVPKMKKINTAALKKLAELSVSNGYGFSEKYWRGFASVSLPGKLPVSDCYAAPCTSACPIHQDVPEYIALAGRKKYAEALALIYSKNPLPSITGHICAHQCEYNCTRIDCESSVEIREIKKICLEKGFGEFRSKLKLPEAVSSVHAAVIGAGPAGLAAAYFLVSAGLKVTVFEKHESAGGAVVWNIPGFRIPREIIEHDVKLISDLGAEFVFGCEKVLNPDGFTSEGFKYVIFATGAPVVRNYELEGNGSKMSSRDFIMKFNSGAADNTLGKNVAVVGGGDTAMDSARAAVRTAGVEKVTVLYRRTLREMPATREEYEGCVSEGVKFMWKRIPEKLENGLLELGITEPGLPDESGRRSFKLTEIKETLNCDTLIYSIGETVDLAGYEAAGYVSDGRGHVVRNEFYETGRENVFLIGDGGNGPSTIVECIAEARMACNAVLEREGISPRNETCELSENQDINAFKNTTLAFPLQKNPGYDMDEFALHESRRCLDCGHICNKCVEVCPNRANAAVKVSGMNNAYQILHLDAFCNECGNCAVFCPWEGRPYADKMTLFSFKEDFDSSTSSGFFLNGNDVMFRIDGKVSDCRIDEEGSIVSGSIGNEFAEKIFRAVYSSHAYLLGPVEK